MLEALTFEPLQAIRATRFRVNLLAAVSCAVVALAVGSLAYGQWAIGGNRDRHLPLNTVARHLTGVFPNPETIVFGIILLVLGGVLLAIGVKPRPDDGSSKADVVRLENLRFFLRWPPLLVAVTALLLDVELIVSLYTHHYHDWFVLVFGVVVALLLWACFLVDRSGGVRKLPKLAWWEAALIIAMAGIFIAINVRDLTNWYYSAQGDEYSFLVIARNIAHGDPLNLFSQRGVYDKSPVAGSAYQSLFMHLPGSDLFDWKLSLVVAIALSLPPFYFLARELTTKRAAVIATAMYASSHYLFAFVHTGYDNILPIPITIAAFALFFLALRHSSAVLALLAGLAAAGGFYTFYCSRAAIVVMAVYFITLPSWRHRWRISLPTGAGFIVGVLPIFAVNGWEVITRMLDQTAIGYNGDIVGDRTHRILENIPRTLLSFNYNPTSQHFVSGSLVDPITAALFGGGLIYALIHIRREPCRFLVIWYAVGLLAVGVLSPYSLPAVSRLNFMVPVVVIFAALALDAAIGRFTDLLEARPRVVLSIFAVAPVLAAVLFLNLNRFWVETPKIQQISSDAVAMRAVFSDECRNRPGVTYVFDQGYMSLLTLVVGAYNLGDRAPLMGTYDDSLPMPLETQTIACAIVVGADDERAAFTEELSHRLPDKQIYYVSERSHRTFVNVLR